jgi:hypothetical protein
MMPRFVAPPAVQFTNPVGWFKIPVAMFATKANGIKK